jgi:hypothetical protein
MLKHEVMVTAPATPCGVQEPGMGVYNQQRMVWGMAYILSKAYREQHYTHLALTLGLRFGV